MNRVTAFLAIGALAISSFAASVRAQNATTGSGKSTREPQKSQRPKAPGITTDFLKSYGSSAEYSSNSGGGGSAPKFVDPLAPDRDNPDTYSSKRHPAPSLEPKTRRTPRSPRVMSSVPPPPDRVRRDREFVNGIYPQSSIYSGSDGSAIRRESDRRAEMARVVPPSTSRTKRPGLPSATRPRSRLSSPKR